MPLTKASIILRFIPNVAGGILPESSTEVEVRLAQASVLGHARRDNCGVYVLHGAYCA